MNQKRKRPPARVGAGYIEALYALYRRPKPEPDQPEAREQAPEGEAEQQEAGGAQ
jgi:hypothetical protein